MPYITQNKRAVLDPVIDQLLNELRGLESDDPTNTHCGNLNYVFTQLLQRSYIQKYAELNEAIGVLECTKLELYRRYAAPYENQKITDNGDVY
jgi:hypothetical protein